MFITVIFSLILVELYYTILIQNSQFSSRYQKYARSNQSKYAKLWLKKTRHAKSLIFNIKNKIPVEIGHKCNHNRQKHAQRIQICIHMIQLSNNVSMDFSPI